MADVVMVVTMVGFVLLCVAYVSWCDRILTRDDPDTTAGPEPTDADGTARQLEQVA